MIDTVTHDIGRNGETESLRGHALWRERHLCRSNTDQPAGEIDHRAPAIAGINCGVGLHQILVLDLLHGDVAFGGPQHATTERAAVAYGVADYHYCITEKIGRNVVEIDEWKNGLGIDIFDYNSDLVDALDVMITVSSMILSR